MLIPLVVFLVFNNDTIIVIVNVIVMLPEAFVFEMMQPIIWNFDIQFLYKKRKLAI